MWHKQGPMGAQGALSDSWFRKKNGPPKGWDGPGWVRAGELVRLPQKFLGDLPIYPPETPKPFFGHPEAPFPKVENLTKGGPNPNPDGESKNAPWG